MARVSFKTGNVKRAIRADMIRRVERASSAVESEVVRLVSRGQPTRISRSGARVGLDPSLPGEPPKVVEGAMRAGIFHRVIVEPQTVRGQIVNPAPQARRLELGFFGVDSLGRNISQEERPHLRPALANKRQIIKRELTGR